MRLLPIRRHAPGVLPPRRLWWLAALLLAATTFVAVLPGTTQTQPSTCARRDVPVTLAPDSSQRYRVAGWLCQPRRRTGTVQVLMSGFSYDHRYWGQPGVSGGSSYLRAALGAGSAVFTVDRIGVGRSDRPPADEVTAQTEAYIAHQVVTALRNGHGGFRRVVGVGHSYGSAIWMIEAAQHHDVDALVLTGYLHQASAAQQALIAASLHPAHLDPAFAATAMPDGYVTTMPGTRASLFFYEPGATASMIALDERTKAVGTIGERATMNLARDPSYSRRLHLPVLLVVGDHDSLACDSAVLSCGSGLDLCQRERLFYPADMPLSAAVVPESGHSINLHRTAPRQYTLINRWIGSRAVAGSHDPAFTTCPA